ncbi:uncharacterized protein [Eurosta solidaginis]|uniref:uncharacterized protein n=1 Tax=Eurosta solidaginis TaxID=178769 RepID=UPI003530AF5C
MLQAIETTPQKYTTKNTLTQTPSPSSNKAQNTPLTANNQSQSSASTEEKQQRRRSTFYVPLVIEDDDNVECARPQSNGSSCSGSLVHVAGGDTSSVGAQSNASLSSSSAALEQKSSSSSSSINVGGKSKAEKNCNNNNLKKSTSLKNASATSKVAALLFERTNSTLGFGAGSSSAQTNVSTGVVKRNSSAKKMSPPCGFNWGISGTTVDTDFDDESDAADGVVAPSAKKVDKEKTKLSKLTHKPEKRHSTSSKSSIASSIATPATPTNNKPQAQPAHKTNANAKTKRYGIVLNGISLDDEHLNITQAASTSRSTTIKGRENLVEFNEDDIMLATPTKQARTTRTSTATSSKQLASVSKHNQIDGSNGRTTHADMDSEEYKRNGRAREGVTYNEGSDDDTNNDDSEHDDEDDDSEISRMQTNTSTPIKMMKSRSRTNILSVPSVEQHNLLSVAAAAAKPNIASTHTTPLLLRGKSKTLPQNLSPSVVLQQPEALYGGDCIGSQTKTKTSGTSTDNNNAGLSRTSRLIGPLSKVHHNLFGGSVASHIGANSATNNANGVCQKCCQLATQQTYAQLICIAL